MEDEEEDEVVEVVEVAQSHTVEKVGDSLSARFEVESCKSLPVEVLHKAMQKQGEIHIFGRVVRSSCIDHLESSDILNTVSESQPSD